MAKAISTLTQNLVNRIARLLGNRAEQVLAHLSDDTLRLAQRGVRGLRFSVTAIDGDKLTATILGTNGEEVKDVPITSLVYAPVSEAWKQARENSLARAAKSSSDDGGKDYSDVLAKLAGLSDAPTVSPTVKTDKPPVKAG